MFFLHNDSMNTKLLFTLFVFCFSFFSNSHLVADIVDDTDTAEDQYFVVVFGYQDGRNSVPGSHTFASFIKAPKGSNLATGKGLEFNDISWLPADFANRLRVDLRINPERGKNYTVKQTFDFVKTKNDLLKRRGLLNDTTKTSVKSFGAFPISKRDFETGLGRITELNSGKIFYKVDDIRARNRSGDGKSPVVNCIHAVSDAYGKPFTGLAHGNDASALVLRFLTEDAKVVDSRATQNAVLSTFIDKLIEKNVEITDGLPHARPAVPGDVHR